MTTKRKKRIYSQEEIEIIESLACHEARESFWKFRQYIGKGKIKIGWWQREVANILQNFYDELIEGQRPTYIITAPPQHGKSTQIIDFLAWASGKNPDLRSFYTSYSQKLGIKANLKMQRILESEIYKKIFPDVKIGKDEKDKGTRNRSMIEYIGHDGYFRNTTVRGSITGESLDIGVIDDPIKGRKEANSSLIRDGVWDWLTDDFFTRFSDEAGTLMILTRWHVDDPAGRFLSQEDEGKNIKVFAYEAIASKDEKNRKQGEALFPEHKTIEFLEKRRSIMSRSSWEALYQQRPTIQGGDFVKLDWFKWYNSYPYRFEKIIQTWDFSRGVNKNKPDDRDYTAGAVWGTVNHDGKKCVYLLDLIRKKMAFPEQCDSVIKLFSKWPQTNVAFFENASNAEAIRDFLLPKIKAIILDNSHMKLGDKEIRFDATTPRIREGHLFLPSRVHYPELATKIDLYLNEVLEFPNSAHDECVDITSLALSKIFPAGDDGFKKDLDDLRKQIRNRYA